MSAFNGLTAPNLHSTCRFTSPVSFSVRVLQESLSSEGAFAVTIGEEVGGGGLGEGRRWMGKGLVRTDP